MALKHSLIALIALAAGGTAQAQVGAAITADIGAFHQGKGRANLIAYGCTTSLAFCNKLASDVNVEELRLQEEVSDYQIYPVLRAGITYSF